MSADAPVVVLKRPKDVAHGFGYSLTALTSARGSMLLVSGAPGLSSAAAFELGEDSGPRLEAIASDVCRSSSPSDRCFLAASPAALGEVDGPEGDRVGFCFAVGAGKAGETAAERGLIVDCVGTERTGFVLPVPPAFDEDLVLSLSEDEAGPLAMSADGASTPSLLVGASDSKLAWVYSSLSAAPVELLPPGTVEASYGSRVASVAAGDARLYVVSAPEAGHVFLFKATGAEAPVYAGCLGESRGFGRALAVGNVTVGDVDPELVISDDSQVFLFQVRTLLELTGAGSSSCSSASLPAGGLYASFGCASNQGIEGCETSDFGAALAVADLDGDGDGEVVVGAPRMKVRDKSGAGAILIYDVETEADQKLADFKFMSSAEQDDLLGSSLIGVPAQGHDVVVAGAPGAGKAAVFYCSALLPPHKVSSRCL